MNVTVDRSSLSGTPWTQFALRFVLGGMVTAGAGLIAQEFGPVVGGLFLAFPAIFPAGATLIARRERQKKERRGLHGTQRGKRAAALDASGAVMGAIGLVCFAWLLWKQLALHRSAVVLPSAGVLWLSVSVALWWVRKKHWFRSGGRERDAP